MENKSHGGKRVGAGRKPLNLEKKMTITLYVPTKDTFPFGNAEKMKEKIYTFISSYHKEVSVQDLTKPSNEIKAFEQPKTNYGINTLQKENKPTEGDYEGYVTKIKECRTIDEVKKVMLSVKNDPQLLWQQKNTLEKIAQLHSKDFYDD